MDALLFGNTVDNHTETDGLKLKTEADAVIQAC